ncbi:hypothetical protein [Pectobacterium parmentieri]|uniref:Uncharacterized protein n=2 Tax=Pectobacterium parmentieri TaxID=1905730 RepID=A0A8B3F7I3_PECPM|nr:hypothetical protein [Pectobacterium parmentieri]AOR58550.1 hypothetical protein A8F97_06470 [Pectobacterium parmentieri]AYH10448.1 hypothetical protein C5E24_12530 [Pectobacterium parmentieri]AYH18841.1 hypothetical protein C5E22_10260 [Pectobacterium parmentieri]AYH36730.1 hypothetical protein C5E17_12275 [Pectobacterium parmentieri]AZS56961.1 hypothetical protein C5E18_12965 [Pectobacterium parmentieri]
MNTEHNYAFPIALTTNIEDIEANYWKCLYTSTDKKMLQYWVILPKRAKPAELTPQHIAEVGLTNLGRYVTDDAQPYMEVWAAYERCQWEMNPADWLFNKLELMGEKVLNQRLIVHPSGSGLFADVLTLKIHSSGDEVISRYTVQKDYNPEEGGGNYFLIKAACAARDYPVLANDIHFTVVNWDLMHRSNLALAELLKTVNLSNKHGSSFKVPESWQVKPLTETRLVVEHTFEGVNFGVINLCFYSQEMLFTAQDVFSVSTKRFHDHEPAVTLTTDELSSIPNEFNSSLGETLLTCRGDIFSTEEKMRAIYQCYIFSAGKIWCYVELVGRHRNHRDYHFEANKRCMDIILSSINIVNSLS